MSIGSSVSDFLAQQRWYVWPLRVLLCWLFLYVVQLAAAFATYPLLPEHSEAYAAQHPVLVTLVEILGSGPIKLLVMMTIG